jgi:hypothetical protein
MSLPSKEYLDTCVKDSDDPLAALLTKCDFFEDLVTCQQLAAHGYMPPGVQSFVPAHWDGGFTLPNGCGSGALGLQYDKLLKKIYFNSPSIPILAVITKDIISKVAYFGSGVTQVGAGANEHSGITTVMSNSYCNR